MSTTASDRSKPASTPAPPGRPRKPDNWRETVESVVVAFVLAFLIRAFEAEAFVIPTGSMAPTLMGRHKDVTCEQCGYQYRVGVGENDRDDDDLHAVCPVCRYANLTEPRSHSGDRILVLKFPYAFKSPKRFDVSVFHYPEAAAQNYIKRLVGKGPEELRIYGGDLYHRKPGESAWTIVRKPPEKQRVLQMIVHDNDFVPAALSPAAQQRWRAGESDTWTPQQDGRSFEAASAPNTAWLRYYHAVPDYDDWDNPGRANPPPRLITDFYAYNASERLSLSESGKHWVGDLTLTFEVDVRQAAGELWCELNEGIGTYQCRFDLASGKVEVLHQIWDADGSELLSEQSVAEAGTALRGTGRHRVAFANVDDRLMLWIDDSLVSFGEGTEGIQYVPPHAEQAVLKAHADRPGQRVVILHPESGASPSSLVRLEQYAEAASGESPLTIAYRPDDRLDNVLKANADAPVLLLGTGAQQQAFFHLHDDLIDRQRIQLYTTGATHSPHDQPPQRPHVTVVHDSPTMRDLAPAGIAADRASVQVSHLRVDRDVYYVAVDTLHRDDSDYGQFSNFDTDPARWPETFDSVRDVVFSLKDGEYLMLGDNSPRSSDSRLWNVGPEVVDDLLIGRAFFIYWPHGKPFLWPNFKRMTFIR